MVLVRFREDGGADFLLTEAGFRAAAVGAAPAAGAPFVLATPVRVAWILFLVLREMVPPRPTVLVTFRPLSFCPEAPPPDPFLGDPDFFLVVRMVWCSG